MLSKSKFSNKQDLHRAIRAARGEEICDFVFKDVHFLDVSTGAFIRGDVAILDGLIVGTKETYKGREEVNGKGLFLVPGFIDSHVHIESSMMTPARFQESVLPCGTTSVIWDPHEIANVKGSEGIQWALEASENLMLDIFVMVPSCVPSTSQVMQLETSGAELLAKHLAPFRKHPRVLGLAEMMNFPGLLMGSDEVLDKIMTFQDEPRDGHCPGLTGKDLNAYGTAGILTCHESTTIAEATEKLQKGIHVWIREGSCAKDADTLLPLINAYSSAVLGLCSDDRNPLDIGHEGHIDFIINKALSMGAAPEHIFRSAAFGPARAYNLNDRGAIAPGYKADLVLIERKGDDWRSGFSVKTVFKGGQQVDRNSLRKTSLERKAGAQSKNLNLNLPTIRDLKVAAKAGATQKVRVIEVRPRQIVTNALVEEMVARDGEIRTDAQRDLLKICVFERHHNTGRRGIGFVRGFNLEKGAIATSINHDSHNIIAVGANDEAIIAAVKELMRVDGGIVVTDGFKKMTHLALPIGGLMTDAAPEEIADKLKELKALTKDLGCMLEEPFLTLSFLALPVIPSLKITDRGLVDVTQFKIVDVVV